MIIPLINRTVPLAEIYTGNCFFESLFDGFTDLRAQLSHLHQQQGIKRFFMPKRRYYFFSIQNTGVRIQVSEPARLRVSETARLRVSETPGERRGESSYSGS